MAFHVPFEHRRNGQPIYIGFSTPPRRRAFNWWAFFGFPFSLFALLTAGILSPFALVMNLIALRRRPRRLATAGTVISLVGVAIISTIAVAATLSGVHQEQRAQQARIAKATRAQNAKTVALVEDLSEEFLDHAVAHEGNLPSWLDANMVATSYQDAWGQPLRFDAEGDHAIIRSAGADLKFDTSDDVTKRVDGQANREISVEL